MNGQDLAANRGGFLSATQCDAIRSHLRWLGTSQALPALRPYVAAWERDLAGGRLVQVDGEIVFDYQAVRHASSARPPAYLTDRAGNAYFGEHITGDGQRIRYAPAPWLESLLPGPHRLYVAPNSGFLVNAESLAASPAVHLSALRDLLLRAQNVTEATLAANRSGRATPEQRSALASKSGGKAGLALPTAVLGIILLASQVPTWLKLLGGVTISMGVWLRLFAISLAGLGILVHSFILSVRGRRARGAEMEDSREGRVGCFEGAIQYKNTMHRGRSLEISRTVCIGERSFDLTRQGEFFSALVKGPVYRVYVGVRSGHLFSIEPRL